MQRYFPGLDVGRLTFGAFLEKLKIMNKWEHPAPVKPGDADAIESPDEWFERAKRGEVELMDGVSPLTGEELQRFRQESDLRKMGIIN